MYKMIRDNDVNRYYELDFTVYEGIHGFEMEKGETNLIMISDAHTHIERLVFPLYLREGYTVQDLIAKRQGAASVDMVQIAGQMTMMIHGGDQDTVLPDENYIHQLYELNKVRNLEYN